MNELIDEFDEIVELLLLLLLLLLLFLRGVKLFCLFKSLLITLSILVLIFSLP